MDNLWRAWPRLIRQLPRHQRLMILSDYDGTLTPIAPTPKQAELARSMRSVLRSLSRLPGVSVGVVSGRSLKEVKRLVGISGVMYVGNHGLELEGPGSFVHPQAQACRPTLRRLALRLQGVLRKVPGAWTEWKGLTISLHWRAVPRSFQPLFHQLVGEVLEPYLKRGVIPPPNASPKAISRPKGREVPLRGTALGGGMIRITYGKRVVEVRPPVDWGKGDALEWLWRHTLRQRRRQRPWLIYLGDDQTDEEAFQAANRLGGLSVFVGHPTRGTAARYWLSGSRQVGDWLAELARSWEQCAVKQRG